MCCRLSHEEPAAESITAGSGSAAAVGAASAALVSAVPLGSEEPAHAQITAVCMQLGLTRR